MREDLEALIASIGCLPILAIGLFLIGALAGEIATVDAPVPPRWLLIPALLLPLFSTLYLRAYRKQRQTARWLDIWRELWRKKVVGRQRNLPSVEEFWLEDQVRRASPRHPLTKVLDNISLWGWAAIISLLALAYIFIWLGLMVARL